ncbi:MAG: M48 family metallopeptidase [Roseburia sp.]|nr:M48 family metallopeptidase [Roseburia sp.]
MEEIILDGISVSVTKKSIKNMYIRVLPPDGTVKISAPRSVSDESICRFAQAKLPWIKEQRKLFQEKPCGAKREYITGEYCYVWGRKYRLEVQESDFGSRVFLSGDNLVLRIKGESDASRREKLLNEWYRKEMRQTVPRLLKKCGDVVGVHAKEWQIKNMRTRWGTCNIAKKRIWLNLQLASKPPECLEYVIIHELVHLLERNHNKRFYGYMDVFYPGWREVRERLNRQGEFYA